MLLEGKTKRRITKIPSEELHWKCDMAARRRGKGGRSVEQKDVVIFHLKSLRNDCMKEAHIRMSSGEKASQTVPHTMMCCGGSFSPTFSHHPSVGGGLEMVWSGMTLADGRAIPGMMA